MNAISRLTAALAPKQTLTDDTAERVLSNGLKAKLSNREATIRQLQKELANVDVLMTTAADRIDFLSAGIETTLTPDAIANVGTPPKLHGLDIRLIEGDDNAPMRYFALKPDDGFDVWLDKIPTSVQKHNLAVKYRGKFKGLPNDKITAFRKIRSLETGDVIKGKTDASYKTWVCGRVYDGNCNCEVKAAKASERQAVKANEQIAYDAQAIEQLRQLGWTPTGKIEERAPGRIDIHDYNSELGNQVSHRMAVKCVMSMSARGIKWAELSGEPYNDIVKYGLDNGVPFDSIAV